MRNLKTFLIAVLTMGLAVSASFSAAAQQRQCGFRGDVVENLQGKYGETRRATGLSRNNGVVEVWASAQTGTWTVVITMPNGMTCLVAAGEHFEPEPAAPAGDPT